MLCIPTWVRPLCIPVTALRARWRPLPGPPPAPRPVPDSQSSDASRSSARSLAMRVYLALVALSAGASATSVLDASKPVEELHAERELMTRSEAKTRQLQRKLPKVKRKREKVDAKVKKVEDALGLPHSVLGDAGPVDNKEEAGEPEDSGEFFHTFTCHDDGTISVGEACADYQCFDCEVDLTNVPQGTCYVVDGTPHTVTCSGKKAVVKVYSKQSSCDDDLPTGGASEVATFDGRGRRGVCRSDACERAEACAAECDARDDCKGGCGAGWSPDNCAECADGCHPCEACHEACDEHKCPYVDSGCRHYFACDRVCEVEDPDYGGLSAGDAFLLGVVTCEQICDQDQEWRDLRVDLLPGEAYHPSRLHSCALCGTYYDDPEDEADDRRVPEGDVCSDAYGIDW